MKAQLAFKDDVINLIANGNWEDVLLTLTHDMNPWDIDLVKLNNRFTKYLLRMKEMDLKIPSKILLAAAIIYRLKVETLRYEEQETIKEIEEIDAEPNEKENIVIPSILVPLKRVPKRKVSIDELVSALQKAMIIKRRRETKEFFKFEINQEDISEKIEELYKKIIDFIEKTEKVTFSLIIRNINNKMEKLKTFNSLLYLLNQERIFCNQEELFGEIYISKL